jgi:predicted nucleotidyltransferase
MMIISLQNDFEHIKAILKKYSIIFAVQYGSSLTSDSYEDIDIAVYAEKKLDVLKLQSDLQVYFEQPLDMVRLSHHTDPLLSHEIMYRGSAIYKTQPDRYHTFRVFVWKKYLDTKKFRDLESAYIKKGIKHVT